MRSSVEVAGAYVAVGGVDVAVGRVVGVAYALLSETAPDGNTALRTDLNLGIASDVLIQLLKRNNVSFTEARL